MSHRLQNAASRRNTLASCNACRIATTPASRLKTWRMIDPAAAVLPPWAYPVLLGAGLAAGFVDSIAGGGGLLTLPTIIAFGLPSRSALGTNKLQATFGSGGAAWHYSKAGLVNPRHCLVGAIFTLAGAVAGTLAVRRIDPNALRHLIPILLLVITAVVAFRPKFGVEQSQARVSDAWFQPVAGLLLGFYDGFIGPGVGTFWTMAFMGARGFNLSRATAHSKVFNFVSNLASFCLFAAAGQVYYGAGLAMAAGQMAGARLGAGLAVKHGFPLIRPIFLGMVILLTAKLVFDSYSH